MAKEEHETVQVIQPVQPVLNEVVEKEISGTVIGQVKWFNDRLGFGFVTINSGPEVGKDIFVHHSGIKPANSNYKTLRKGEYVNFNIIKGLNGLQAVDITGINGGPLMCDIVMGSRRIGEPFVPQQYPQQYPQQHQQQQQQQYVPHHQQSRDPNWQTIPRKPYVPRTQGAYANAVTGQQQQPPHQQQQYPTTTKNPVKNYNKYNKATRHLPAGAHATPTAHVTFTTHVAPTLVATPATTV